VTQPVSERPVVHRRRFALLLWFGLLGGGIAWAAHVITAWGTVELVCTEGRSDVLGIPLRAVVTVLTVGPGVVALSALVAAAVAGAQLRRIDSDGDDRRVLRAQFMAEVGLWLDGLAIAMIVFGAVAIIELSPCLR
jgi:hypothetical protein